MLHDRRLRRILVFLHQRRRLRRRARAKGELATEAAEGDGGAGGDTACGRGGLGRGREEVGEDGGRGCAGRNGALCGADVRGRAWGGGSLERRRVAFILRRGREGGRTAGVGGDGDGLGVLHVVVRHSGSGRREVE